MFSTYFAFQLYDDIEQTLRQTTQFAKPAIQYSMRQILKLLSNDIEQTLRQTIQLAKSAIQYSMQQDLGRIFRVLISKFHIIWFLMLSMT
jgi:hypothetical protein